MSTVKAKVNSHSTTDDKRTLTFAAFIATAIVLDQPTQNEDRGLLLRLIAREILVDPLSPQSASDLFEEFDPCEEAGLTDLWDEYCNARCAFSLLA